MNELKNIIKNVISSEIDPDGGVFSDGFILQPINVITGLKGDGTPEEVSTQYQLDFFYKNKGEITARAKELLFELGDYPTNDLSFTWEGTARLWRATVFIEKV